MTDKKTIHPERKKRLEKALKFFSVAAWVTGLRLLVLTTRMICDYIFHMEIPAWAAQGIGPIHGLFYMIYFVSTVNLTMVARWKVGKAFLVALAGTIPFLSFVAEYYVRKRRKRSLA